MEAQEKLDAIRSALAKIKEQEASLGDMSTSDVATSAAGVVAGLGSIAGSIALGYHGYKRNHDSLGWGFGWFLLGGLFPVGTAVGAVVAWDQGFAKPIATPTPAKT